MAITKLGEWLLEIVVFNVLTEAMPSRQICLVCISPNLNLLVSKKNPECLCKENQADDTLSFLINAVPSGSGSWRGRDTSSRSSYCFTEH